MADLVIPVLMGNILHFKSYTMSKIGLCLDIINNIIGCGLYITYHSLNNIIDSGMNIYMASIDSYGFTKTDILFSYGIYTLKPPTLY